MAERVEQATDEVMITLITRIELLRGRFVSVFKAENAENDVHISRRRRGLNPSDS